jgi:hypothetical protein
MNSAEEKPRGHGVSALDLPIINHFKLGRLHPKRASIVRVLRTVGILVLSGVHAAAQGTVNFNHRISNVLITRVYGPYAFDISRVQVGNGAVDFPVGDTDWNGWTRLSGPTCLAQLRAAPGPDVADGDLLWAQSSATPFRTGTAAGCVWPVTSTLTGVPVDAPVATMQMFAWDNSSGMYPDAASAYKDWNNGFVFAGLSPKFNVYSIGGGTNLPATLDGLQSFNIHHKSWYPPWITITHQPSDQSVSLTVLSDPGSVYHLQTSTNLIDWTELVAVTNSPGSNTTVNLDSLQSQRRFYRAAP